MPWTAMCQSVANSFADPAGTSFFESMDGPRHDAEAMETRGPSDDARPREFLTRDSQWQRKLRTKDQFSSQPPIAACSLATPPTQMAKR
jgi:hypothetical protein